MWLSDIGQDGWCWTKGLRPDVWETQKQTVMSYVIWLFLGKCHFVRILIFSLTLSSEAKSFSLYPLAVCLCVSVCWPVSYLCSMCANMCLCLPVWDPSALICAHRPPNIHLPGSLCGRRLPGWIRYDFICPWLPTISSVSLTVVFLSWHQNLNLTESHARCIKRVK